MGFNQHWRQLASAHDNQGLGIFASQVAGCQGGGRGSAPAGQLTTINTGQGLARGAIAQQVNAADRGHAAIRILGENVHHLHPKIARLFTLIFPRRHQQHRSLPVLTLNGMMVARWCYDAASESTFQLVDERIPGQVFGDDFRVEYLHTLSSRSGCLQRKTPVMHGLQGRTPSHFLM